MTLEIRNGKNAALEFKEAYTSRCRDRLRAKRNNGEAERKRIP